MTKNSLDLSGKINLTTIKLYEVINRVAKELKISYVVVGATARDLVLHYGCGTRIKRATSDVDFGMQVASWEIFEKLTNKLIEHGFQTTKSAHRFIDPQNIPIDVIPFGAVENNMSNIQLPPEGIVEMSALGFQEAQEHAINVIIQQKPLIEVRVATSQGLALLKLVSWSERDRSERKRDAQDFAYLLETYEKVDVVKERIYEEEGLMEQYDWDLSLASAHMLGVDAVAISQETTKQHINTILEKNLNIKDLNIFVEEMCEHQEYEEKLSLLKAFANGFKA